MKNILFAKNSNKLSVAILFFLSGFSGLIYQILWMRKFKLVLGSSVFSVSIVVAAFMIGLLLGSWIIGKGISLNKIKNELKLYGLLELFIGIYSLLFLSVITHTAPIYSFIYHLSDHYFYIKLILNATITLAVLVLPTIAMGATLPLLINYYSKQISDFRSIVSLFYAINTLGGAFAALISGFYLIHFFGVNNSILIAAAINVTIGIWGFLLSRKHTTKTIPQELHTEPSIKANSDKLTTSGKQILFLSLLTGFMAISYEVLWVRSLNYLLNNSTYTFSLILFVFLAGIAAGSFLNKFLLSIRDKYRLLAIMQFILCIGALFSVYVFYSFAYSDFFKNTFISSNALSTGWYDNIGLNLYLTIIIFLIPSLIMGISFPLISELYFQYKKEKPGTAISSIYTYNMLGSILGSLLPIFVLIPVIGSIKYTLVAVIILNLLVAVFLMYQSNVKRKAFASGLMIILFSVLFFSFNKGNQLYSLEGINEEQMTDEVSFYEEGIMATVKVYNKRGQHKSLSIDGVTIGSGAFHAKEKTIAHLPFLTDRKIKSVLAVGLASGTTAGSMLYHQEVERMTVVEIVQTVIDAAHLFNYTNNNVSTNQKVNIICDDITSYLMHTDLSFDLISSDGKFGALNRANTTMLSQDFYELCSKRLTPHGLFIQWISTEIPGKHFKTVLATTQNSFPYSELFLIRKNLFIVSSKAPIHIDTKKIKTHLNNSILSNELSECYIYSPEDVLSSYCGSIQKPNKSIAISSFDRPVLEYDFNTEREKDIQLNKSSSLVNILYLYEQFLLNDSLEFNKVIQSEHKRDYTSNKNYLQSRIAYIKGHINLQKNNVNDAYKYFLEVVSYNHPDNWNDIAVSSKLLAEMKINNKDYQAAVLFCNKSIELLPDYADAYTLRGVANYYLNLQQASKKDFEKALSINAQDQTAIQFLRELNK